MATTTIYNGVVGTIAGSTPFGLYDLDSSFVSDGPKIVDWCARRIGYPIVDIELQSGSFFACFEEAVTEYSSQKLKRQLETMRKQLMLMLLLLEL